jgi:membrane protease subunit (stomatin/prohibitin family)
MLKQVTFNLIGKDAELSNTVIKVAVTEYLRQHGMQVHDLEIQTFPKTS